MRQDPKAQVTASYVPPLCWASTINWRQPERSILYSLSLSPRTRYRATQVKPNERTGSTSSSGVSTKLLQHQHNRIRFPNHLQNCQFRAHRRLPFSQCRSKSTSLGQLSQHLTLSLHSTLTLRAATDLSSCGAKSHQLPLPLRPTQIRTSCCHNKTRKC